LVIENLQAASRAGIRILNYVELLSYEPMDQAVQVQLKKPRNGNERLSIRTKLMINATGAWVDQVRERSSQPEKTKKLRIGSRRPFWMFIPRSPHILFISPPPTAVSSLFLKEKKDGLIYPESEPRNDLSKTMNLRLDQTLRG